MSGASAVIKITKYNIILGDQQFAFLCNCINALTVSNSTCTELNPVTLHCDEDKKKGLVKLNTQ